MRARNKTERYIQDQLNPRSPFKARFNLENELEDKDAMQKMSAWHFLTTGEQGKGALPPYGKVWDRDYNPIPYPEARPDDPEFFMGTGIGLLYGIIGCDEHAWQLAGWNIVRTGSEQRKRRK